MQLVHLRTNQILGEVNHGAASLRHSLMRCRRAGVTLTDRLRCDIGQPTKGDCAMASEKKPDDPEKIEENDEVRSDKDAKPDEPVSIELPVEPNDPNAQTV